MGSIDLERTLQQVSMRTADWDALRALAATLESAAEVEDTSLLVFYRFVLGYCVGVGWVQQVLLLYIRATLRSRVKRKKTSSSGPQC